MAFVILNSYRNKTLENLKVMMVCLGNICRSPLAHGILEDRVRALGLDWSVESSGTSGWHVGELPDRRSIDVARENGLDISGQRSRKFEKEYLEEYDLIVAMDASNFSSITALADNKAQKDKVKMLLNFSFPNENRQVPDPYYSGGFQMVYDMISQAVDDLIQAHT